IQHLQHFFVGSPVQRPGERGGRGGRAKKGVRLRTAGGAHHVRAAVLLVVGVQDKQDVQRPSQGRVRTVLRFHHLPQHVHKVLGVLWDHRVVGNVAYPVRQLRGGGQLPKKDQIGDFQEGAPFRQLLDGISAIPQNTLVPVDERDRALARRRVHERGIVGHQS